MMQFPEEFDEDNYIIFPPPGRSRAKFLIHELEKEFMRLYSENTDMKKKLQELGITELHSAEKKKTRALKIPFFKKKEAEFESKMVRTMRFHEDIVWDVRPCYDPKEEVYFVVSGGADCRSHVILEDENLKKPVITYTGHRGSVNHISYDQKSGLICSSSGDGTCHLWKADLSAFSDYYNVNPFELSAERFDLDDDVRSLDTLEQDVESHDDVLDGEPGSKPHIPRSMEDFRTVVTNKNYGVLMHENVVQCSSYVPQSGRKSMKILTACWDNKIRLFDVERKQLEDSLDGLEYRRLVDVSVSGKGMNLVVSGGKSGVVRFWDMRDFTSGPRMELRAHEKGLNCAQFTKDEKYLLTAGEGGTCKMWDLNILQRPVRSITMKTEINKITVSNDGSKFCLSLTKPMATVHDAKTGKLLFRCRSDIAHNKMITGCALSESSRYGHGTKNIFTSSIDQGIVQWKYKKAQKQ